MPVTQGVVTPHDILLSREVWFLAGPCPYRAPIDKFEGRVQVSICTFKGL